MKQLVVGKYKSPRVADTQSTEYKDITQHGYNAEFESHKLKQMDR